MEVSEEETEEGLVAVGRENGDDASTGITVVFY